MSFAKVMIEGGLMSWPSCVAALAHCSLGTVAQSCHDADLILTNQGPCYRRYLDGV